MGRYYVKHMRLFGRRDNLLSTSTRDPRCEIDALRDVTVAWADEVDTPVVIARGDSALYCAKSEGRNCVRVASDAVSVS